ncbi:MAG: response regulator [Thermodesulfobacteriota bacterium]
MKSSPKILIVDDEERFRTTMCKLLTIRGFDAVAVEGGPKAIEHAKEQPCDVVILDVRMPEMSGVDVLAEIKKVDADIEVIIMTGYASVDTAKEILTRGAYDYMLKPYSIDELVEKIEAANERRQTRTRLKEQAVD